MSLRAVLAAALLSLATGAMAADPVRLKAVSPDGDRAVVVYRSLWAEISLGQGGDALPLYPPRGCAWTSASYQPNGELLALTGYCPPVRAACDDARALLYTSPAFDRPKRAFAAAKTRWEGVMWRSGGDDLAVIETPLVAPLATSLGDLNRRNLSCANGTPRFAVLDPGRKARIKLDITPREWSPRRIIAADLSTLVAIVRIAPTTAQVGPIRDQLNEICKSRADQPSHLAAICRAPGTEKLIKWRDGEWTMDENAALHPGRRLVGPGGEAIRERCTVQIISGRAKTACAIEIDGETGLQRVIEAANGMLGDIALSRDELFSLNSTHGVRVPHFHAYDLKSGGMRDLSHLLDLRQFATLPSQ